MANVASRPARGAWIEMDLTRAAWLTASGRAPRGARGLKLPVIENVVESIVSRPARGAWIEIPRPTEWRMGTGVAPREGRVD